MDNLTAEKLEGLTSREAAANLQRFGLNDVMTTNDRSALLLFLDKFLNPLIIMLILVALFSWFFGERLSSIIVILMALLSVILSFIQEHQANRQAEKLEQMVQLTATVFRDGRFEEIPTEEVVPGDLVKLHAGAMVPADGEVLSARDLFVNQSILTGESFPVSKKDKDALLMGTNVTSGEAEMRVIRTGRQTQFGQISGEITRTRARTAFDEGIRNFVKLMMKFILVLAVFIFVVNALLKHELLESLLFALAVAVGLTPDMLSMIVTVNLAKGAKEMAKRKIIVKELAAIQNFGAMDILCTDKTGTLTINEITLIRHFDALGQENEEIAKLAYLGSFFVNSTDNLFDQAIKKHYRVKMDNYTKIGEIPFDYNRRAMSVVVEDDTHRIILITKGAPETLWRKLLKVKIKDKIEVLSADHLTQCQKLYEESSREGFRVLLLATKETVRRQKYAVSDEEGLTLIGFLAFLDPPKDSAKAAVDQLEDLGIKLKIISGDGELVTRKICQEVGLNNPSDADTQGIDKLNEAQLREMVEKVNIFSRISPLQKERILKALQANGHIVGFLGDGINDSPALEAADVGISVNNAADVAKETANIILLEKSLLALADCVKVGRRTFANVIKYIKMGASSNFGNMLSMTVASIFLPFLPMLPPQILLNNFLYDASQTAIPTDQVDEDYLKNPRPWNIDFIRRFMIFIGPVSSIFDLATFAVMWYVFRASPELFHTGWFLESLFTQVLVIYIIRTNKIPFVQSSPSRIVIYITLGILILAALVPYTFLAKFLGFEPLPLLFFLILLAMVVLYLFLTQIVKSWFIRRFGFE